MAHHVICVMVIVEGHLQIRCLLAELPLHLAQMLGAVLV